MENKTVIQAGEGTHEVILRNGAAPEVFAPVAINKTGTLKAPADYITHKVKNYKFNECTLYVFRHTGKLELALSEKHERGDKITGQVRQHPLVDEFGINTDKKWSINEFRQFIQRKSFFFDSLEEYNKILAGLQKFKANVVRIYENHKTNDGNAKLMLENQVQETNAIPTFKLKFPLYLGYQDVNFVVNVGLDVSSAETRLFLYSEELDRLLQELKNQYIDEELERIETLLGDEPCSFVNMD